MQGENASLFMFLAMCWGQSSPITLIPKKSKDFTWLIEAVKMQAAVQSAETWLASQFLVTMKAAEDHIIHNAQNVVAWA